MLAGVAQGCPASAMVFCVVADVRTFLALLRVPPLGARRALQVVGVYGQHHMVYRLKIGFAGIRR